MAGEKPTVLWQSDPVISGEEYRIVGQKRGAAKVSPQMSNFLELPILLAVEIVKGQDALGTPHWIGKTNSVTIQLAWDLLKANGLPGWVAAEADKHAEKG